MSRYLGFFIVAFLTILSVKTGYGRTFYGISISGSTLHHKAVQRISANPILAHQSTTSYVGIGTPHRAVNNDANFLYCLILLLFFGFFRQMHPHYLRGTFNAFGNATLNQRQLQSRLQQSLVPRLLLDLFFFFSTAIFLFQAAHFNPVTQWFFNYPSAIIILSLAVIIALIYAIRLMFLRLAGWIFRASKIANSYAFTIFLFNRVLGILLIPFTIIITFGSEFWAHVFIVLAFSLALFFYIMRFVRTRKVFNRFLKFSKFHFILYLCASEIIPLAVVIKLLTTHAQG